MSYLTFTMHMLFAVRRLAYQGTEFFWGGLEQQSETAGKRTQ